MFQMIVQGGWTIVPLVIGSVLGWAVLFERSWYYFRISKILKEFHLQVSNSLLRNEMDQVRGLLAREPEVPTAILVQTALDRLQAKEPELRKNWVSAVERQRLLVNQDLRKNLWVLGTIGSSAPFIGLAGTVIGILQSFHEIAKKGSGGFTVVAAGISEALIATAAGIVVAVISVIAYNALQVRVGQVILQVKIQAEELLELLHLKFPA